MLELNRSLDADCLLSLDHDESDIIRADVEANELVNEIYAYCVFKLMWFSISFLLSNYAIFSLCQKILDINSILTDVWFTQNRRGGGYFGKPLGSNLKKKCKFAQMKSLIAKSSNLAKCV